MGAAERMLLVLLLLWCCCRVSSDVIFTTQRCDREQYGLQIVRGDPSRYKQCGPSGRVWIVPCAPGLTFHPEDRVCKERQETESTLLPPMRRLGTTPAVDAPVEEFIFSTRRPKRPRTRKGKIRKTTTPMPMTSLKPSVTSQYIPPTATYSTESMEDITTSKPYSAVFLPPNQQYRSTTMRPRSSEEMVSSVEYNIHPSTRTVAAVTMQPEYTVKYNGMSMTEQEFLSKKKLVNLVKEQKSLNIQREREKERERLLQLEREAEARQQAEEARIREEEEQKRREEELIAALQREREQAEMERIQNERLQKLAREKLKKRLEEEAEQRRLAEEKRRIQEEFEREQTRLREIEQQRRLERQKRIEEEKQKKVAEEERKRKLEMRRQRLLEKKRLEEELKRRQQEEEEERRLIEEEEEMERQRELLKKKKLEEEERRRKMAEEEEERRRKMIEEEENRKREEEERQRLEQERRQKLIEEEERRKKILETQQKQRQAEEEAQRQLEQGRRQAEERQRQEELRKAEERKKEEQKRKEEYELEMARREAEKLEKARLLNAQREKEEEERRQKAIEIAQWEEAQRKLQQKKMEREKEEMEKLLAQERAFNRLGTGEKPVFPQISLPGDGQNVRYPSNPKPSEDGIIRFTTVTPIMESWVTSSNSWKPPPEWTGNTVEENEDYHKTSPMPHKVYNGCIINGDCPLSYEEDTFCEHPTNPSHYLQCSPMYGRKGRWTERFCPDSLIFVKELARCDKGFPGIQTGTYSPKGNVVIPRLPSENSNVQWQGNRVIDTEKPHSIYQTIDGFPRELVPQVMTTTYPTVVPIHPQLRPNNNYNQNNNNIHRPHIYPPPSATNQQQQNLYQGPRVQNIPQYPLQQFYSRTTAAPSADDLDLSLIHPLFPRVQPKFLNKLLPIFSRPMKDDNRRSPMMNSLIKPVIKQIAMDQTSNFIDRLLADDVTSSSSSEMTKQRLRTDQKP